MKPTTTPDAAVRAIYRTLARACGPQHWWPAETPFEVIVGAILTQNTSWTNVERAMRSLRSAGVLSPDGIRSIAEADLQQLVRSSGYFRQKTERLKMFVSFLDQHYGGSLSKMFATPTAQLREELLSLKGIGRETADAILLYAGNHEVFVVDAYTQRIFARHRLVGDRAKYDDIRTFVERALHREVPAASNNSSARLKIHDPSPMSATKRSPRAQVYNEMHGLLVQVGKHYCHRQELKCSECPLRQLLPETGPRIEINAANP